MNPPSEPQVPLGLAQEPGCVATPASPSRWSGSRSSTSSLGQPLPVGPTAAGAQADAWVPFPTVDVPDHAHYTMGTVILLVGLTGMLGNLTVIYTFCRSRGLRTPANMFIINLAVSDFLMSFTQAPVFFASSLYKQWLFGKAGAYVPEGLLTSCSWDYMTFTPSVRAYTMLLMCFVFFLPLLVIVYCYVFIFRAIRETGRYAHVLTPYMNSVPAVIAKASAIHNPIIYAIIHPKYRMAIAQHLPCLGVLLGVSSQRTRPYTSYRSTHRSTLSSQGSDLSWISGRRRQASLGSESEVGWMDTEAAAVWGAAQQMSGWSPCGQGLEDMEAKAPPRPQGWEGEALRKVIGPSTCQSVKGGDKGHVAQGMARSRGCSPAWTPGCRVPNGSPSLLGHIQPPHVPLTHTDPGLPCEPAGF
ncbi:melanopsin isoform X5 [Equus caballus]|uniref:melanopsin isoform X5 n=1 Tax=Equus caballus TaxID=9796 RepID=UPI0038B3E5BD